MGHTHDQHATARRLRWKVGAAALAASVLTAGGTLIMPSAVSAVPRTKVLQVLPAAAASSAKAFAGSPFNAADGALDAGVTAVTDRPSGQSDDSYKMGAKENDPCPTVELHKVLPHKDDLLKLYGAASGTVLYLAWTRAPGGQGTATIDFELNQATTKCANGVNPKRTVGDLLFGYDFRAGNILGVVVQAWNGVSWGPPVSLDPAIEQASVAGNQLFGELAVDVGALPPAVGLTTCETFAGAFAKSRAS